MRAGALLVLAATLVSTGCSEPTAPTYDDIDEAYAAWTSLAATSYTFELVVASSWGGPRAFARVDVRDGEVVAVRDHNYKIVDTRLAAPITVIWADILYAREQDEINTVRFSAQGVPVYADLGEWAIDGGRHYEIRGFEMTD